MLHGASIASARQPASCQLSCETNVSSKSSHATVHQAELNKGAQRLGLRHLDTVLVQRTAAVPSFQDSLTQEDGLEETVPDLPPQGPSALLSQPDSDATSTGAAHAPGCERWPCHSMNPWQTFQCLHDTIQVASIREQTLSQWSWMSGGQDVRLCILCNNLMHGLEHY